MIKIALVIPVLLIAVSAHAARQDTLKTLEGGLRLYGNEPFTRIALVTDEEERWFLEMEDEKLEKMWRENRGRIKITGTPGVAYVLGRKHNVINVADYTWVDDDPDNNDAGNKKKNNHKEPDTD